jgi:hypothetical protein
VSCFKGEDEHYREVILYACIPSKLTFAYIHLTVLCYYGIMSLTFGNSNMKKVTTFEIEATSQTCNVEFVKLLTHDNMSVFKVL